MGRDYHPAPDERAQAHLEVILNSRRSATWEHEFRLAVDCFVSLFDEATAVSSAGTAHEDLSSVEKRATQRALVELVAQYKDSELPHDVLLFAVEQALERLTPSNGSDDELKEIFDNIVGRASELTGDARIAFIIGLQSLAEKHTDGPYVSDALRAVSTEAVGR